MRKATKDEIKDFIENHDPSTSFRIHVPQPIWHWDVFGGGLLIVTTYQDVPWRRRLLTKIFLGSTWTRL